MTTENYYLSIYSFYRNSKKYFFDQNTDWLNRLASEREMVFDHDKLKHHQKIFHHYLSNNNQKVNIFIIGEGNYGKSTLINAIVKGNLAKINFLPTTWCVQRYLYGDQKAKIYSYPDKVEELSIKEAQILFDEEEKKCLSNKAYSPLVYQIDWFYTEYPILDTFTIVDTPGLAQLRTILSDRSIEEYYYKADCVLWLLDAGRVNSESTYKFISQVSRFSKKIIGVINKWDTKSDEAKPRILHEANKYFAEYFSTIVPVSAKIGYDNLGDEQKYNESQLPILLDKIHELFLKNERLNKNIQFYYTMKLALRESKGILSSEYKNQIDNLTLYRNNLELINATQINILKNAVFECKSEYKSFFENIYSSIRMNVTFKNAKYYVTEVLSSSKINSNIDKILALAKNVIDKKYYDLIQELSSKQYIDIVYKYDGSVLSKNELSKLSDVPDISRNYYLTIKININFSLGTKVLESIGEFLSFIPFINSMLVSKRQEMHTEIIKIIKEQVSLNWHPLENIIRNNINDIFIKLEQNFNEQFKIHFNSIKHLEQNIDNTNSKLSRTDIPEYLYSYRLLKLLQRDYNYA